jgi:two-component system response regulator YesN
MYKLILVDDEEEVREGILKRIEWGKYGFEIVGSAANGRDALDICEKVTPDVVITDIKMPFMDGLELTSILRERVPAAKVIIITGFDEFEYAQKAIKQNVFDYILKPVAYGETVNILKKIKDSMDKEKANAEDMKKLNEYYLKSLPIIREKFLSSLILNRIPEKEIFERLRSYKIDFCGKRFVAIKVSIDFFVLDDTPKTFNTKLIKERELLKFSVYNICDEIINNYKLGTVFIHDDSIVIIVMSELETEEEMYDYFIVALEEIRQKVYKFTHFSVTIGIGTVEEDISNINRSYRESEIAVDYRVIMGGNRIIWIRDIEPSNKATFKFDKDIKQELESDIKLGSYLKVEEILDKIFEDIIKYKVSVKEYQLYLMEVLTSIMQVAQSLNIEVADMLGENYNVFIELYKFNDINEVKKWLQSLCYKIMERISKGIQSSYKKAVDNAVNYIMKNYNDSEMNVNKICTYLYLSPTHFSFIFKKEMKMTFLNYLVKVRMEAAMELLKTTNLKSFEVAEKVGFSDSNYFSYSFKKYCGMSPKEYRNSSQV